MTFLLMTIRIVHKETAEVLFTIEDALVVPNVGEDVTISSPSIFPFARYRVVERLFSAYEGRRGKGWCVTLYVG